MLKGIDVSSWNGKPFNEITEKGYKNSDFIIAKATQSINYVNPYCDYAIQRAIKDNKLFGFYHYAGGDTPELEAQYFYDNCKGYIGNGIPALDWESEQNAGWGSTEWCRRFVDKFHALSGVWPIIYTSQSCISQIANCVNDCGLWVAQWETSSVGNITPWNTWTIWQWTSNNGTLDENYANLTKETWIKIAKGDNVDNKATDNKATNNKATDNKATDLDEAIKTIAYAVIAGKYGNGNARKEALYKAIQDKVNRLLS